MSDFINKLHELNVSEDSFLTLSYTEGNDVWHINDGYVNDSVNETNTAGYLATLLTSGIPVYSTYGGTGDGSDILNAMRNDGELDNYERGEGYFDEYITERLQATIYEGEYALEHSTEQYDYKRGRCDISTSVRVRAGDLYAAQAATIGRFGHAMFDAGDLVSGFNVTVETDNGTLTLNQKG